MVDVTLTFDNGPDRAVTPAVLDTLDAAGIQATFFVLGKKLADPACRDIAADCAARGHWIGNHTFSHITPLGLDRAPDLIEREIERTQALIGGLSHPDKLFRPFGGGGAIGPHLLRPDVLEHLKANAYSCVLWNVIPRDWEDAEAWPERAMRLIKGQDWPLVVLHDIPGGAMDHLPRFIDMVRASGCTFRQDFPPDCILLDKGRETVEMGPYVGRQ